MLKLKKIILIFVILFVSFFIFNSEKSTGLGLNVSISNATSFIIGNGSIVYNLTISVGNVITGDNTSAAYSVNVTVFMPYGIVNASKICNSFVYINSTTNSCNYTLPANLAAGATNITQIPVSATIGAYSRNYTVMQPFNVKALCGNCSNSLTGGFNITALENLNATNFWINPRPYAEASGSGLANGTFFFYEWGQIRPYYEIWMPLFTYNSTLGKPQPANQSYAEIFYTDKSFIEGPSYMEMWGYRLNFTIDYNANETSQYNIFTPAINTTLQTLNPLLITTMQTLLLNGSNVTTNMALPMPTGFSVRYNNTLYTDISLLTNYNINISYNQGFGVSNDYRLLTVTLPSYITSGGSMNFSILFTLMGNVSGSTSTVSPVYVENQVIEGFLPTDTQPELGGNKSLAFYATIKNQLSNFTLTDLRLRLLTPINITLNSTSETFNISENRRIGWINGTNNWMSTSYVTESQVQNIAINETCYPMNDNLPGSPTRGSLLTICFKTYDINLTAFNYTYNFNRWYPGSAASNMTVNLTALLKFPTIKESVSQSCTAGSVNYYNTTISMSQRSALNLTARMAGGCLNSDRPNISVKLDNQVLTNNSNYTVGSFYLNDVSQGTHTVTITYQVSPSATTTTTSASSSDSSAAKTEVSNTETQIIVKINPGEDASVKFSGTKLGINEIIIGVNEAVSIVKITVTSQSENPLSEAVSGNVYKYIKIDKTNLEDNNIKNLKIRFQIEKSWLEAKPGEISLQHFTDKWDKLQTNLISEDDNYKYYEAESPSLSYFAIVSEPAITTEELIGEEKETTEVVPKSKLTNWKLWVLIIIVVVIIALVYLLLVSRKGKK